MSAASYYSDMGGLPGPTHLATGRAVFTTAYTVIPKGVMADIVTSRLPFWRDARFWVIARPLSGFAETFSHYIAEVQPGGGSERPETEKGIEAVLFVVAGEMELNLDGTTHRLAEGGYAFIAPGARWTLANPGSAPVKFHWIRKAYEAVDGLDAPDSFVTSDAEQPRNRMPNGHDGWMTTRFVAGDDLRHDMHVNIVTFDPGASIPFKETHVMEHGLYVLQGRAVYHLNQDWVEVEAGDYMWLRAFCPQACYAGGPGQFRYLLYKNVNRHMSLGG
ncbi:MAG: bifunctional allantoicase/(S)-ureidoglycine aminohydrolase [Pseudomonadota bacterium]|nr:bifunctional allantoicase/(S)-ureidoglycine aminohydrolase [Pseudomonadota bacterium]